LGLSGSSQTRNEDQITFGVYHSPEEFTKKALAVEHPYLQQPALPDCLLTAIFNICTRSPLETSQKRTEFIKRLRKMRDELKPEEDKLRSTMHPTVAKALQGKHLVLFKKLLEESNYPDVDLVKDMAAGFPIIGLSPPSGAFPKEVVPPAISEADLIKLSSWAKISVMANIKSSGDPDLDQHVWNDTIEERDRGWLIETTSQQLDREFGDWIPARRFGINQKGKNRSIDDYSIGFTNMAYGRSEKLRLMGLDQLIAMVRFFSDLMRLDFIKVKLSDGKVLSGRLHPYWKSARKTSKLMGRLLDLWKAYRGLAFDPSDRSARFTIVAVYDPTSKSAKLFKQPVLAFGSTASVMSFNRVSRAMWHLGCHFLDLAWVNYFDDFPHLEMEELAVSALESSELLLTILGWRVSMGDKRLKFAISFMPLGADVDLKAAVSDGFLIISNKPGRLESISELAFQIRDRGMIRPLELERLRGLLQFAEAFVFGKFSKFAFAAFSRDLVTNSRAVIPLDTIKSEALHRLGVCILDLKPRKIPVAFHPSPFVVFTDGACESLDGIDFRNATCGAVVFHSFEKFWFSLKIPDDLTKLWRDQGDKQQVIAEAEMLPIIIARTFLESSADFKLCLHFVDNDGDIDCLIKGTSDSESLRDMTAIYVEQECDKRVASWITRVPSPSNLADAPSRMEFPFKDGIDRGVDRSEEAETAMAEIMTRLTRKKKMESSGVCVSAPGMEFPYLLNPSFGFLSTFSQGM
jgi:hypothetical protein